MVIVEVGQSRIDHFRAQVGMLLQQFFRRSTVVVMLGGEMLDLVARVANPCGAIVGNDDVRVNRGGTHAKTPLLFIQSNRIQVFNPSVIQNLYDNALGVPDVNGRIHDGSSKFMMRRKNSPAKRAFSVPRTLPCQASFQESVFAKSSRQSNQLRGDGVWAGSI